MEFKNKSVLITGGTRGIGLATAEAFAAQGARVALNFRSDNQQAQSALRRLEGSGHFAAKADVSKPGATERLVQRVVDELGGIDILVNNAGVFLPHAIDQVGYDDWQSAWKRTLETNLIGPANLCYCAAQHMLRKGKGRIVNVGSRGAYRGEPGHPAYAASKAGLHALSQSLAQALAPHGIAVMAVAPGFVHTDMAAESLKGAKGKAIRAQSPFNRVARPEEVAEAILYLASSRSTFSSGCVLDLNGASYLR